MKYRSAAFIFLAIFIIPSESRAQQRNQQLNSVLESCSQKMGSEFAKRDIYVQGTIIYAGNEDSPAPFEWKAKEGDRVRQDVTFPTGVSTHIVNRGRGSRRLDGKREKLPAQNTAYFRSEYLPALS